VIQEVLSNWRTASVGDRLHTTLGFLEKLTLTPGKVVPADVASLRAAGVSERAVIDAIYVCVGFNIINRIADALAFKVPPPKAFAGGVKFLRLFGYKLLSGSFTGHNDLQRTYLASEGASVADGAPTPDPYLLMVKRLRESVLDERGTLNLAVREAATAVAEVPGVVGRYIRKVAQGDYTYIDTDISALRQEGYSDDQLFESTVSAALGAGLERRHAGLSALWGVGPHPLSV
jgi:alkylhydroperoxidase family enzyme